MKSAAVPENETDRLAALRAYDILDTDSEKDFENIVRLVSHVCGTPMSTVSFVDSDRQWFKARVGLDSAETPRDVAFCAHTILGDELFVVEDAATDERFRDNPLVTDAPGIRFYAGMPLRTEEGLNLGALCAIDRRPRHLTDEQKATLAVLARHVVTLLDLRSANRRVAEQNLRLQELSELKSRLMSIMAHDLRSPMANIVSLISLLNRQELPEDEQEELLTELSHILKSTEFLLNNVIGWSSRELGSAPFAVSEIDPAVFANDLVDSVAHEAGNKANRVVADVTTEAVIYSDTNVLVFILRNLLVNANKFTAEGTITLSISDSPDTDGEQPAQIVFAVSDTGIGMDPDQLESLFDWSRRRRSIGTAGERGAGLALLFCGDFAERIGGRLTVDSTPGFGSTFRLIVPREWSFAEG